MAGPAPTELIHRTDQDTEKLHTVVGNKLKEINQPGETIPAHEQPVLSEGLQRDINDALTYAGSTAEDFISGKDQDSDVRVTSGKGPFRWALEKIKGVSKNKWK